MMTELFSNGDIFTAIIAMAPSIGGIIGIVVTCILSIRKVAMMIADFKQSNELKELIATIKAQQAENKQLRKMNEKLLGELTRIQPKGYTDDNGNDKD